MESFGFDYLSVREEAFLRVHSEDRSDREEQDRQEWEDLIDAAQETA